MFKLALLVISALIRIYVSFVTLFLHLYFVFFGWICYFTKRKHISCLQRCCVLVGVVVVFFRECKEYNKQSFTVIYSSPSYTGTILSVSSLLCFLYLIMITGSFSISICRWFIYCKLFCSICLHCFVYEREENKQITLSFKTYLILF